MWIMRTGAISALMIGMAACATAPKPEPESRSLDARASATLGSMKSRDPGLTNLLDSAYAYAVFPEIGNRKVVGEDSTGGEQGSVAAYGRGVLFEQGRRMSGYVELNQRSMGAELGGETPSELVVFHDRSAVDQLKAGMFELGVNDGGFPVEPGAADSVATNFTSRVAVFTMSQRSRTAQLSISGQKLSYQPRG
jgi:lipid-binding SYLF domain-containing protein